MGEAYRLTLGLICACARAFVLARACVLVRVCSCVAARMPGASQAKYKEAQAVLDANGLKIGDAKKAPAETKVEGKKA
jgi:hypothetical protein